METAARPTGIATASVGGGRAWPDIGNDAPIRIIHHDPTGMEGAGGTGGPGRASRRGAERSEVAQPRGRPGPTAPGIPAGPSCGARGRRRSPAGQRADAPGHAQRYSAAGVEGTGGTGGHGQPDPTAPGILAGPSCGARGRRQGLAGQRADAPSEARGADGERAGRRPRAQAHQATQPSAYLITATPRPKRPRRAARAGPGRGSG